MPGKELVLIDTSVWIQADSLKANSEVKSKVLLLLDEDRVAVCGIITAELLCGAKTPANYEELKNRPRRHSLPEYARRCLVKSGSDEL